MTRRVENLLLIILLVLLPSQLAYHFWPDWSLVNGVRVDYLSPAIYFTDVLIGALMVLHKKFYRLNRLVILFAVINIFQAALPQVALYKWLKLYEFYWLYRYLVSRADIATWRKGLAIAVGWTSFLAIAQFALQHSVGGIMYWLGERRFDISTPGIARVVVLGRQILRPYATLPHPNALGGWLLLAGVLTTGMTTAISWITVVSTFSRSALILLPGLVGLKLFAQSKQKNLIVLVVLTLLIGALVFMRFGNPTSISERVVLNQAAVIAITNSPLLGVGLGNFIPTQVPFIRQPVHNIYLLLAAELGLPLTIVISYWLIKKINILRQSKQWLLLGGLISILIIGLVDHYWLTLQQNILLAVVFLATAKISTDVKRL